VKSAFARWADQNIRIFEIDENLGLKCPKGWAVDTAQPLIETTNVAR
jgi:hypothetical protein